jgi:hypothetical protein
VKPQALDDQPVVFVQDVIGTCAQSSGSPFPLAPGDPAGFRAYPAGIPCVL